MRTVSLLLLAIIPGSSCVAGEPQLSHPDRVTKHTDLVFATVGDRDLKLDLYIPREAQSPKLVVWIHGGGWRQGSKNKQRIKFVTDHGFALASISYRFTPQHTFPAQIHDCKAAIRWLRAHAEKYGYDGSNIAVAGGSAGGHLALLLGTSGDVEELEGDLGDHLDQSSRVQAVIDYYGPSDFLLREKTQPERALTEKSGSFALLDGLKTGKVDRQKAKAASPVTWVSKDDPPLLIIHGKADDVVLPDQAEVMAEAYQQHNCDVTLMLHKAAKHGSQELFKGEYRDAAIDFLRRTLTAE